MKKVSKIFNFNNSSLVKKLLVVALLVLVVSPTFAESGASALASATDDIKNNWYPAVKALMQVIGGVVGVVGALRIYSKWTNGDQDINKEIMGWGGAALFLILAPQMISALFNM